MKSTVVAGAIFVVGVGVLAASYVLPRRAAETPGPAVKPTVALLPATFILPEPPAGVMTIEEARPTAKVGDTVAIKGRVGGSRAPFVDGQAVFTIVGRGITACNDVPGHHCPTPWDYCHIPRNEITTNSATVQMVDSSGEALRASVKGLSGIKELSEIVVVGKVAQTENNTLVVNATGVYVVTP